MAVGYDSTIYNSLMDEAAKALEECRDEIRRNMAANNENATHRTEAGIQVVRYEGGVMLVSGAAVNMPTGDGGTEQVAGGTAPLYTLETGRGAGKVPYGFASIIYAWSQAKGIQFVNDKERWSFAYATKNKIRREGTQRNAHPVDVYSTAVNTAVAKLPKAVKAEVSQYVRFLAKDLKMRIKTK